MKKLAAILAAALISLTVALPVFAEPDNSSNTQSTVQNSAESSAQTSQQSDAQTSGSHESSAGDNRASSAAPQQNSAASEAKEEVTLKEHRIEAGDMTIGIPSDMYVITRDTDKDDPVLAVNRTTKEEITKPSIPIQSATCLLSARKTCRVLLISCWSLMSIQAVPDRLITACCF